MNAESARQHGYVLLLTLVMVALVAAGTVGLTRISLASATESKRAELDLQRRWAVISCRRVLLESGPRLLESKWESMVEPEGGETQPHYATLDREHARVFIDRVKLGKFIVDIRLADEQAKLNVNTLLNELDREEASRLIDSVTGAHGARWPVELKPVQDEEQDDGVGSVPSFERLFRGFDPRQMFAGTYSGDISGSKGQLLPVDGVSCWGDGRLRLSLASDEALRALLAPHLDSTRLERLIELRNEQPDITIDQMMRALSLGATQSSPVRRLLTDQSDCFSLWLTVRNERRSWHRLDIVRARGNPAERHLTYLW